jgi:hypothetical protein
MSSKKKELRNKFKSEVFKRDKFSCKWCDKKYSQESAEVFLDAHHITDRNEMPNGGYVKENGITLCKFGADGTEQDSCHMKAEKFHISGGQEWEPGMHPGDLYKLISSSQEEAIKESEKL